MRDEHTRGPRSVVEARDESRQSCQEVGVTVLDNQVELRVEALLVRLYIHVGDRYPGSESESRIARARRG